MVTDSYPLRVRENILPLSLANNLPEAFGEWFFTERIHDHETPDADCELCNQEELRYHFQIKNEYTEKELWVGSSCILKFGLSVFDEGKLLDKKNTKKKLAALTKKMQLESCIKALETLADKEGGGILQGALDYYKREKRLTPKQAFVVFWRMQERGIDHCPSFFKIALRRDQHKYDLQKMSTYKVHKFWKALTPSQRKLAQARGHKPPQ